MKTMKAYVRTSAQDQHVELAQISIPQVKEGQVLVKVEAFGVGIHDRYFIPADADFPYTIGTEASGVIVETGSNVTGFKPQDRVFFMTVLQKQGGCWAPYVTVSQDALVRLPAELDFTQGAVIPIAGKTALDSMRALALEPGQTLFVAGASGAIGTLVIQLAIAAGARVIGSASSKNHAYMLSLGAEKAVDYADPDWKQHVQQWQPGGVCAALAIQPNTAQDSVQVVKDHGRVITVSNDKAESQRNIRVEQFQHHQDTQPALTKLASDIAQKNIRLVIEHVYPFSEALDALRKTETRHARGKVAVRVNHV